MLLARGGGSGEDESSVQFHRMVRLLSAVLLKTVMTIRKTYGLGIMLKCSSNHLILACVDRAFDRFQLSICHLLAPSGFSTEIKKKLYSSVLLSALAFMYNSSSRGFWWHGTVRNATLRRSQANGIAENGQITSDWHNKRCAGRSRAWLLPPKWHFGAVEPYFHTWKKLGVTCRPYCEAPW